MEDEIIHCHCTKKKERSEEEYKSLIHRLNRIEGQVRGIRTMVENSAYCTDILVQSSAVSAAITESFWQTTSAPVLRRTYAAETMRS